MIDKLHQLIKWYRQKQLLYYSLLNVFSTAKFLTWQVIGLWRGAEGLPGGDLCQKPPLLVCDRSSATFYLCTGGPGDSPGSGPSFLRPWTGTASKTFPSEGHYSWTQVLSHWTRHWHHWYIDHPITAILHLKDAVFIECSKRSEKYYHWIFSFSKKWRILLVTFYIWTIEFMELYTSTSIVNLIGNKWMVEQSKSSKRYTKNPACSHIIFYVIVLNFYIK